MLSILRKVSPIWLLDYDSMSLKLETLSKFFCVLPFIVYRDFKIDKWFTESFLITNLWCYMIYWSEENGNMLKVKFYTIWDRPNCNGDVVTGVMWLSYRQISVETVRYPSYQPKMRFFSFPFYDVGTIGSLLPSYHDWCLMVCPTNLNRGRAITSRSRFAIRIVTRSR